MITYLGIMGLAAAGGFSGVLTTTIMAPGERVKCLLQVRLLMSAKWEKVRMLITDWKSKIDCGVCFWKLDLSRSLHFSQL